MSSPIEGREVMERPLGASRRESNLGKDDPAAFKEDRHFTTVLNE